jgi:putative ABC transport system permease protein
MRLASFAESARAAIITLRAHPLRSLLSTLGVTAGVMALTAAFATADGVDVWARYLIERESSVQDVVLSSRSTEVVNGIDVPVRHYPVFTLEDWADARSAIANTAGVLLTLTSTSRASVPGHQRQIQLTLSTSNLPDVSALDVAAGRFFTQAEVNHKADVVVLNHRLAEELAVPFDPLWVLGRPVWINDRRAVVIGILSPRTGEHDFLAFAPLGNPALLLDRAIQPLLPALRIKAASIEAVPTVREATVDWVARRRHGDLRGVEIDVGLDRLERSRQGILLSKLLLGFLVALMLAIGGIGIMNIMLATVTERTQEIGIRKSVGARMADIRAQFLVEALVISSTGSLIGFVSGVVLAVGGTAVFRSITAAQIYPVFRGITLGLVILAAVSVGLIFGTYPARRASQLTVIDAITRA